MQDFAEKTRIYTATVHREAAERLAEVQDLERLAAEEQDSFDADRDDEWLSRKANRWARQVARAAVDEG